jgi:hypothetical protein
MLIFFSIPSKIYKRRHRMKHAEYIESVIDEIIRLLIRIGIPSADGPFRIGSYRVEISPDKKTFSFWEDGQRRVKEITISERARVVSVVLPGKILKVNILDPDFPSIEETVWKDGGHPRFDSVWIGWNEAENVKKGVLSELRIEFDESLHLIYQKKNTGYGYYVINPMGIILQSYKLPLKLEKARKILGVPIARNIRFNKKMESIMRVINLEKFLEELRMSAGSKISPLFLGINIQLCNRISLQDFMFFFMGSIMISILLLIYLKIDMFSGQKYG